jgi:hypothetical protein
VTGKREVQPNFEIGVKCEILDSGQRVHPSCYIDHPVPSTRIIA